MAHNSSEIEASGDRPDSAAQDPARLVLSQSADKHAAAALAHVASGDYAGEHWLASFAVFLLSTTEN